MRSLELEQRHIAELAQRARVVFGSLTGVVWTVELQPVSAQPGRFRVSFRLARASAPSKRLSWTVTPAWLASYEDVALARSRAIALTLRDMRAALRAEPDYRDHLLPQYFQKAVRAGRLSPAAGAHAARLALNLPFDAGGHHAHLHVSGR
jgi:hypothetical protein